MPFPSRFSQMLSPDEHSKEQTQTIANFLKKELFTYLTLINIYTAY